MKGLCEIKKEPSTFKKSGKSPLFNSEFSDFICILSSPNESGSLFMISELNLISLFTPGFEESVDDGLVVFFA